MQKKTRKLTVTFTIFPQQQKKVVMGGGRQEFLPTTAQDIEGKHGKRTDGINLIKHWQNKHKKHNAEYVQTKDELLKVHSILSIFFFFLLLPFF